MKKPEELLEEFKRDREKMTPAQRVEAYRAFNNALAEALKESSSRVKKARAR